MAALKAAYLAAPSAASLSSVTIASVLTREAWRRTPDWIKEDPALRKSFMTRCGSGGDSVDDDEMASLSALVEKLQGLAEAGSEKLDCPLSGAQIHASVLAAIQIAAQLRERNPDAMDELYERTGPRCAGDDVSGLEEALKFAVWSYEEDEETLRTKLEGIDFFLLEMRVPDRPGYVGHFVALSPERKTLLVGVKGTASFEDFLTDVCGRVVTYENDGTNEGSDRPSAGRQAIEVHDREEVWVDGDSIEVHPSGGVFVRDCADEIRCHEGMLISARRLADAVQRYVEQLVLLSGYRLLVSGHSLGAGTGSLLPVILRSRFPALAERTDRMKVFAFACPPVLDHDTAISCSPYTTTIVNNSDIVPRSSLANLAVFLEFLKTLHGRLEERGMSPTGPRSAAALFRKLYEGTGGEMLLSPEEVREAMTAAREREEPLDPGHLYVPGRVIIMSEHRRDDRDSERASIERLPMQGTVSFGTATVLRLIDLDIHRMFSDHSTYSYEASIHALSDLTA